jgi:glutaredoxin
VARLTLYGRKGCHLCDEARAVLVAIGEPFDDVDIESDDDLLKRYLERIPVIALGREELCDYHVDEALLLDRLHYLGRR